MAAQLQSDLLADDWFSEEELAERLKCRAGTLQEWRRRGIGPRFFRIGNKINYTARHVNEWLQSQIQTPCNSFPVAETPSVDRLNRKNMTRAEKRDLLARQTRGIH